MRLSASVDRLGGERDRDADTYAMAVAVIIDYRRRWVLDFEAPGVMQRRNLDAFLDSLGDDQ